MARWPAWSVAVACLVSGILGALEPHFMKTIMAKSKTANDVLLPLRPTFDPLGQSFSNVSGRTEVDCLKVNKTTLLVLGQSNSTNEDEGEFTPPGHVFNFNIFDGKCYVAEDPLLGTTGMGGSYMGRLGTLLVKANLATDVLIVPIAHGTTWIADWASGPMKPRLDYTLDTLKAAGIKLTDVLWQQGENEGALRNPNPIAYRRDFNMIAAAIRGRGIEAPIYVAQSTACRHAPNEIIRAAQLSLIDEGSNIRRGPDTDLIPLSERYDGCHFNAVGLDHVAELWRDAIR